jgi:Ala-tRNA(Pro) deacylase
MAIAHKVQDYMTEHGVRYDIVTHPHSHNSMETAELAHVPGHRLAKSVILEDEDGFVMAVLPSTCHVRLGVLSRELNRRLHLAQESQLQFLFADCELGAIPPVGLAYGLPTVIDERLADMPEIYFEAGDHEQLVRIDRDQFAVLMEHVGHARFARA